MSQPSFASVAELQRKIAKYFKHCEKSGDFPSVLGLCVSMRITRETLRVYAHDKKYSDTIKRAKDEIYYKKYQSAAKGDMDVRVFMFDCINNDRDMINTRSEQKSKTELTGKDGLPLNVIISSTDAKL